MYTYIHILLTILPVQYKRKYKKKIISNYGNRSKDTIRAHSQNETINIKRPMMNSFRLEIRLHFTHIYGIQMCECMFDLQYSAF